MINQLETLNQLENPLVKKQNEIFLLTEQLSERENIFANISIKIKELKKASSRQIIELKSVDSILIKKYQQDELNHCREKISEITKLINSYDAKKKDAEKVHDNLINEIQNINNPKSLLVIPKLNTKENSKEVASKSMSKVDYNSKINGHKADPEISKIIEKETQLEELKAQYEKYLYDNNCLEKECQLRSQELEGKLTKLSTAEIQNQNPTSGET